MTDTPPATRSSTPGWRDPRLWVGIAIVAASVLVGALVLGSSDDTVPVWAASDAMGAGHVLTGDDLTVRRVHFADPADADLYVSASRRLPARSRLVRGVGAGELLPIGSVGGPDAGTYREVPISVAADQVPTGISAGAVVDVYLRPSTHTGCARSPVCNGDPVLSGVTVVDAPVVDQQFGTGDTRMLVLGMTEPDAHTFFRLLASTEDPAITVVGRG